MINILFSILFVLLIMAVSLLCHELAHAFVARKQGMQIKEMSLGSGPELFQLSLLGFPCKIRPIIGLARVVYAKQENDPISWKSRIAVSLAGPTMSLILGILLLAIHVVNTGSSQIDLFHDSYGLDITIPGLPYLFFSLHRVIVENLGNVLFTAGVFNLMIFFFAMLPIVESDGGKAIFLFLDHKEIYKARLDNYVVFSTIFKNIFHLSVLGLSIRDIFYLVRYLWKTATI